MKLNVHVPNSNHVAAMTQPWEHDLTATDIAEAVRTADELGFNKMMLGEHFVVPAEHVPLSGEHYFNGVVALAFLGAHTRRMKLASSVTILPLQNPAVIAKSWSTVDWLCAGRAEPMFGVGWLKEEFDILGASFHERGKVADEYMAAIIELWTKERASFEGRYVRFHEVALAPKPLQKPHPPIWFGGDAKGMLARVARFGDGWSPFRTPPEKFPESLDFIRGHPAYRGQPLEMFFALSMLNVGAHHEIMDDDRSAGGWDAQRIIDQCGWLAELGVTETIVPDPPLDGLPAYLDRLRWVAAEIMPKVA